MVFKNNYSTFHLANQRSLNVKPILIRKVFSLIMPVASVRTNWPLIFKIERLLILLIIGIPKPALTEYSLDHPDHLSYNKVLHN